MNVLDLNVHAKLIRAAIPGTTRWCAVVLAIYEQVPGAKHAEVQVDGMRLTIGDQRYLFPPTPELLQYLPDFDAELSIKPFRIHSENPQIVTNVPRGTPTVRVGELRATKPARSPRNRRLGRKVNPGTVADDLKEFPEIPTALVEQAS